MIPFPPVVEPDLPGAYITKHPRDIIEPHGLSIPFMAGLTKDEGNMKSARKETYLNMKFVKFTDLFVERSHHQPSRAVRRLQDQP